jgi:hypothetical protein
MNKVRRRLLLLAAAVGLAVGGVVAGGGVPADAQDCGSWGCFPTSPNPGSGWHEVIVVSTQAGDGNECWATDGLARLDPVYWNTCNGSSDDQQWWFRTWTAGGIPYAEFVIRDYANGTWLAMGYSGGEWKLETPSDTSTYFYMADDTNYQSLLEYQGSTDAFVVPAGHVDAPLGQTTSPDWPSQSFTPESLCFDWTDCAS